MYQDGEDKRAVEANKEGNGAIKNVEKRVRVEAEVVIKPRVIVIDSELDAGPCENIKLKAAKKDEYTFIVSQDLCLNIPLRFDAEVEVKRQGIQGNLSGMEDEEETKQERRKPEIDPGWMID
ncbi:hypothetical protein V1502_02855 [Bacillus sp. SCS-153A]|uniref:hypothetical protein n=1 Tax=Rossellomorea sedimentorum TaxID=3115294 RepID=UPI00390656D3